MCINVHRKRIETIGDYFASIVEILKDIKPENDFVRTLKKGLSMVFYGDFINVPAEVVTLLETISKYVFRSVIEEGNELSQDIIGNRNREMIFKPTGVFDKQFVKLTDQHERIVIKAQEGWRHDTFLKVFLLPMVKLTSIMPKKIKALTIKRLLYNVPPEVYMIGNGSDFLDHGLKSEINDIANKEFARDGGIVKQSFKGVLGDISSSNAVSEEDYEKILKEQIQILKATEASFKDIECKIRKKYRDRFKMN